MADEPVVPVKKTVIIADFAPFDSESSGAINSQIFDSLKDAISAKGYSVEKSNQQTPVDRLSNAKENNIPFLIEGFYQKKSEKTNLNIYAQVYDPATGFIIDAFNISDEIFQGQDLAIDSGDLLEPDSVRIEKFSKKLSQLIRSNSKRKENRENIEQFVINSKISSKNKFALTSGEKATEEATAQVFDLLQNQVTTSATKVAKKTSEAPNIVSVIQQKELQDYGRVSMNDVLYNLPGFAASQINDRRTVSARGMYEGWNNNHLLLLMDGVQFNESFYGSALTWEVTPLNLVKSMEVIRGPGSALYGSNATNGVISLNTFSGEDLKGGYKTRARVGDYGTRIYDLLTGNTGKLFSYVLSYNSYETNGNNYKNYDGSGTTDAFNYLQKFEHKDRRNNYYMFAKLEGQGALKGLSIQYHRQEWNYQAFNGWLQNVPDYKDKMSEQRDNVVTKYTNNIGDKLTQEYVVKYGVGVWNYNTRFFPNSPSNPAGVWENLKNSISSLFARAQLTYRFGNGGTLVGGVEGNQLKYNGDSIHNSNVDLNLLGTGQPFPNGGLMQLNPSMDWITNKPINKVAPFAQATSGKIIDKKLEFTLGVRYDETNIHFRGIDMPYGGILGYPTADITDSNGNLVYNGTVPTKNLGPPFVTNEKKVYRKTSPRAGVVFFATSDLTFKAMSGIAFREPSPGELFGVNTLVGGSNNPRKLSPEVIRTSEIAMDYFIKKYLNLRVNGFQTRFENVIDYNGTSNAVSNVYSVGTRGIESEILLSYKNITGFINYSRFQRFLDSNLDSLISKHPNEVTISPASIANAGTTVHWEKFMFSTSVHYQGATHRKTSDLGPIDPLTGYLMQNTYSDPNSYPQYRPKVIPAWTSVNLRTMYKFSENFQIGIYFTNIFNTTQLLVQRSDYPFDYIREGRRVMFEFIGNF